MNNEDMMEVSLRTEALRLILSSLPVGDKTPSTIVEEANTFYQFMKQG